MFKIKKINVKKDSLLSWLLIVLIFYFLFYFLFSRYGFINYANFKASKNKADIKLQEVIVKNKHLEDKISYLKEENLDKDLLDEQVRQNLGYVKENELIIYYEK